MTQAERMAWTLVVFLMCVVAAFVGVTLYLTVLNDRDPVTVAPCPHPKGMP